MRLSRMRYLQRIREKLYMRPRPVIPPITQTAFGSTVHTDIIQSNRPRYDTILGAAMKKSEKEAKEKLRNHPQALVTDHVTKVTRKGAGMEYNQGQAVKQGFGSGIKDILASRKKK